VRRRPHSKRTGEGSRPVHRLLELERLLLSSGIELVQPTRLKLPLLDPLWHREFRIVTPDLLDEAFRVFAADEDVDGIAQHVARERVVDDGLDDHRDTMTRNVRRIEMAQTDIAGRQAGTSRSPRPISA
jgi:hypothetical protein